MNYKEVIRKHKKIITLVGIGLLSVLLIVSVSFGIKHFSKDKKDENRSASVTPNTTTTPEIPKEDKNSKEDPKKEEKGSESEKQSTSGSESGTGSGSASRSGGNSGTSSESGTGVTTTPSTYVAPPSTGSVETQPETKKLTNEKDERWRNKIRRN